MDLEQLTPSVTVHYYIMPVGAVNPRIALMVRVGGTARQEN